MNPNENELQEYAKQFGQVVAKAWADDDFKARLLQDPAAVLSEEGLPVPAGVEIRAVENTNKVVYLTLPPKPTEELTDEQLSQMSGGGTASSAGSFATAFTVCGTISTSSSAASAGTYG